MIIMEFKERLKQYRLENELTQEDLAKKLFVSRQAISKYETGRGYPNLETMQLISKLLNLSLEELLSKEEVAKETIKTNQKNRRNKFIFMTLFLICIGITCVTCITCIIAFQNKKRIEEKEEFPRNQDLIGMVGTSSTQAPTIEDIKEENVFGYCVLRESEQKVGRSINVSKLATQVSNTETKFFMDILYDSKNLIFKFYEVYYQETKGEYLFVPSYTALPHQINHLTFDMERNQFHWEFTFNFKPIDTLKSIKIYEYGMDGKILKESILERKDYIISQECLYVVIEEEFQDAKGNNYKNREVIYNSMIDKTYHYSLKSLNTKGFCTEILVLHKY